MSKKNKLTIIFIVSFFVVFVVLVYYLVVVNNQKLVTQIGKKIALTDRQWQISIMKDIAQKLQKYEDLNGIELSSSSSARMLWNRDGYLIYIPKVDSIGITQNSIPGGIYSGDLVKIYNETRLGSISQEISKVFKDNKYSLNYLNSTKLEGRGDFVESYEKDETFCSLTLSSDVFGLKRSVSMGVACASVNELNKLYAEQKPYIDIMGYRGEQIAITSENKVGDFLAIDVTDGVEGAGYILKYENSKYIIIAGPLQESPQCETMDKYGVPREIYIDCYEKDNSLRFNSRS